MKVKDLLGAGPVPTVRADDDLALASQIMLWAGRRHLPVLRGGALVGVISEGDILRRQARLGAREAARDTVGSAMTAPAETIDPDSEVTAAAARMVERRVSSLPVMSGGALVGVISSQEVLGYQAARGARPPVTRGSTRAVDIMTPLPEVTSEADNLIDAVARMRQKRIRHLPVVDADGRVIGMLSDGDVRAAIGDPRRAPLGGAEAAAQVRFMSVGQAMTAPVLVARQDEDLAELARHFLNWRVGALPVVGPDQRLLGIISYLDLLAAVYPATERAGQSRQESGEDLAAIASEARQGDAGRP
jgi:CBS domain-containing protein